MARFISLLCFLLIVFILLVFTLDAIFTHEYTDIYIFVRNFFRLVRVEPALWCAASAGSRRARRRPRRRPAIRRQRTLCRRLPRQRLGRRRRRQCRPLAHCIRNESAAGERNSVLRVRAAHPTADARGAGATATAAPNSNARGRVQQQRHSSGRAESINAYLNGNGATAVPAAPPAAAAAGGAGRAWGARAARQAAAPALHLPDGAGGARVQRPQHTAARVQANDTYAVGSLLLPHTCRAFSSPIASQSLNSSSTICSTISSSSTCTSARRSA